MRMGAVCLRMGAVSFCFLVPLSLAHQHQQVLLSGLVTCCICTSLIFVVSPQLDVFFVGALLLVVCAQHHCDCCFLFLFLPLPAVWIQGWISYTTPTCISPINELWQTTFPFSVCDILNEQPFFDYFLTDLIWKRLFSFCSVLTSSAIPATATQSYRHFIFVVHFGKKFWHTKCSLERRKASWHASLISSTVLLRKRRRWESSHPRNLFPDWGKKMVNEYMTF